MISQQQAEKCHIGGQTATSSSEERQAFIACKARDKGTAFLKGRRLKLSETQALEPQECFRFPISDPKSFLFTLPRAYLIPEKRWKQENCKRYLPTQQSMLSFLRADHALLCSPSPTKYQL